VHPRSRGRPICLWDMSPRDSLRYPHNESRTVESTESEEDVKDTVGLRLREEWKEQGKSGCSHPELSKEYTFSGTATEWVLCTTCGHRMRMEQA
jgi:hypothetical protein